MKHALAYLIAAKHWYFHAIIVSAPMVSGEIGLAVSQSSDPLGTYFIHHIRLTSDDLSGCGGVDCFPDYPHGGYDANALFISTRLIHCPACFVTSAVYVLSKAQLEVSLTMGGSPNLAGSSSRTTSSCSPAFQPRMSPLKPPMAAPNTWWGLLPATLCASLQYPIRARSTLRPAACS
jgi:hypothetical protein